MRFDVNLASKPFINHLPHAVLLSVLAVLAVLFTVANVTLFARARAESRHLESRLEATDLAIAERDERAQELEKVVSSVDLSLLKEKASAATDVLSEEAISWALLLDLLEEALPWSAQLRSVRTQVRHGAVSMSIEMKSRNAEYTYEFIKALEASPCFSDVWPSSEEKQDNGDFLVHLQAEHDPYCGSGPPPEQRDRRRRRRG